MYRLAISFFIGLILTAVAVGPAPRASSPVAAAGDRSAAKQGPRAVFPKLKHEFQPVLEGARIRHDFIIENHGDAPLVIKNIRPD